MADHRWVSKLQDRLSEHGGHFVKLSGKGHPLWEIGRHKVSFPGQHAAGDVNLPMIKAREVETAITKHLTDLEMAGTTVTCACHRPGVPVTVPLVSHSREIEYTTGLPVLKPGEAALLQAQAALEGARQPGGTPDTTTTQEPASGGDNTVLDMRETLREEREELAVAKKQKAKGIPSMECPFCGKPVWGRHMSTHTPAERAEWEKMKPSKTERGKAYRARRKAKAEKKPVKPAKEKAEKLRVDGSLDLKPKTLHVTTIKSGKVAADTEIETLFETLKKKMLALKYERDQAVKHAETAEKDLDVMRKEMEPFREMVARLFPKGK